MEIGEPIKPPTLVDLSDDCPFDHELEQPPEVKNDLVGLGSTLASSMNSGRSTKLYAPYAPADSDKVKWGKLPQKDSSHPFFKRGPGKGRCVTVSFDNGTSKDFPVSCSAHHLVPSQESLQDHDILQYMCKKATSGEHNHKYGGGRVWSDVGYDTNGSENGVYLPGNYAVGGGRGGLNVWYPTDSEDDQEDDEGYIDPEKAPPDEYREFLLRGEKGKTSRSNPCWQYVARAIRLAPGQFHDRHFHYSDVIVKGALTAILENYQRKDFEFYPQACGKCKDRAQKIKEMGLPAPYSIVQRLETISKRLRTYLTKQWRENVYTSEWMNNYMKAVKAGEPTKGDSEVP